PCVVKLPEVEVVSTARAVPGHGELGGFAVVVGGLGRRGRPGRLPNPPWPQAGPPPPRRPGLLRGQVIVWYGPRTRSHYGQALPMAALPARPPVGRRCDPGAGARAHLLPRRHGQRRRRSGARTAVARLPDHRHRLRRADGGPPPPPRHRGGDYHLRYRPGRAG